MKKIQKELSRLFPNSYIEVIHELNSKGSLFKAFIEDYDVWRGGLSPECESIEDLNKLLDLTIPAYKAPDVTTSENKVLRVLYNNDTPVQVVLNQFMDENSMVIIVHPSLMKD